MRSRRKRKSGAYSCKNKLAQTRPDFACTRGKWSRSARYLREMGPRRAQVAIGACTPTPLPHGHSCAKAPAGSCWARSASNVSGAPLSSEVWDTAARVADDKLSPLLFVGPNSCQGCGSSRTSSAFTKAAEPSVRAWGREAACYLKRADRRADQPPTPAL